MSDKKERIPIGALRSREGGAPRLLKYLRERYKDLYLRHVDGQPVRPVNVTIGVDERLRPRWAVFSGRRKIGEYSYVAEPIDGDIEEKRYVIGQGRNAKELIWSYEHGRMDSNREIPFP